MSTPRYRVDLETLRRFDRPGPRYTSYPTAVEFHPDVDGAVYADELRALAAGDSEEPLSLYIHLPFCRERCRFCACHVVVTRKEEVATRYLDYVKREVALVAELLGKRRTLVQTAWGGGTPTWFSPEQLAGLYRHVSDHFPTAQGAEVAIEVDPRVTTAEHLDTLTALGFNRLSMGVQDFTEEVQVAIGRNQELDQTRALIERARQAGFDEGLNVDLVYGLPKQTVEAFDRGLDHVLELRPARLAIYSFAYVPWIKAHQRRLLEEELPTPEVKLELYLTALNRLVDAGYDPIGMDHFALPEDELARAARQGRLARSFMGYTVRPASTMLGFGVSAIGDLHGGYFQNEKKLSDYYRALDDGRLPVERGCRVDDDDRLRRYVITQLMCNFVVRKAEVARRFGREFDEYFASSIPRLSELIDEGFVENRPDEIRVVGNGRFFVRNVAMAFDGYLGSKGRGGQTFSRTV